MPNSNVDSKELDFGQQAGMEFPEQIDLVRRRILRQQMYDQLLKSQNANYQRSPIAVGLDFLNAHNARKDIQALTAEEQANYAKNKAATQGELQQLISGMTQQSTPQAGPTQDGGSLPNIGGDPQAALLRALSSDHKQVRDLSQALFKNRANNFGGMVEHLKDYITPESAIAGARTQDVTQLQPRGPGVAPQAGQSSINGGPPMTYMTTTDNKGQQSVHFPPAQSNVSVNTAQRPFQEALEQQAKYWSPGGKGYDETTHLNAQLNDIQGVLNTMAQNPQMGAGTELFQNARKWAQTLSGSISDATTPTELARMQLGQMVYNKLGTLGAQVSNTDRDLMMKWQGEVSSDPTALKHLMLLQAKYLMLLSNRQQDAAAPIRNHPMAKQVGLDIPEPHVFFTPPNDLSSTFDDMLLNRTPKFAAPKLRPPSRITPAAE